MAWVEGGRSASVCPCAPVLDRAYHSHTRGRGRGAREKRKRNRGKKDEAPAGARGRRMRAGGRTSEPSENACLISPSCCGWRWLRVKSWSRLVERVWYCVGCTERENERGGRFLPSPFPFSYRASAVICGAVFFSLSSPPFLPHKTPLSHSGVRGRGWGRRDGQPLSS